MGVQAASIVTDAFTLSGDAMARTRGAPGYRYAMVPHPLSNLTPDECRARARDVLPDVLSILGLAGDEQPAARETAAATPAASAPERVSVADLTADRVRDLQRVVE